LPEWKRFSFSNSEIPADFPKSLGLEQYERVYGYRDGESFLIVGLFKGEYPDANKYGFRWDIFRIIPGEEDMYSRMYAKRRADQWLRSQRNWTPEVAKIANDIIDEIIREEKEQEV